MPININYQLEESLQNLYNSIIKRKIDEAHKHFLLCHELAAVTKSETLLNGFQLMHARYLFSIKNEPDASKHLIDNMNSDLLTEKQKYLFYINRGLQEVRLKKYNESIYFFEKAEDYLYLFDIHEEALFHYSKAAPFYYLDINPLSLFHVKKAFDIYHKIQDISIEVLNCHNVIALNYIDTREMDLAIKHLSASLQIAEELNHSESYILIHHNLGFAYMHIENYKKAALHLEKATKDPQHYQYKSAVVYLVKSLFLSGSHTKANNYLREVLTFANKTEDEEYKWRLNMLHAKFVDTDRYEEIYESGIKYFEQNGIYYTMREYARELSLYYWGKDRLEKFYKYHKISLSNKFQ